VLNLVIDNQMYFKLCYYQKLNHFISSFAIKGFFVLYLHQLITITLWGDETGRHALLSRGWRFWNKSFG